MNNQTPTATSTRSLSGIGSALFKLSYVPAVSFSKDKPHDIPTDETKLSSFSLGSFGKDYVSFPSSLDDSSVQQNTFKSNQQDSSDEEILCNSPPKTPYWEILPDYYNPSSRAQGSGSFSSATSSSDSFYSANPSFSRSKPIPIPLSSYSQPRGRATQEMRAKQQHNRRETRSFNNEELEPFTPPQALFEGIFDLEL